MLSSKELCEIFDTLKTPRKGRELVEKARKKAPVRAVKSQGGNVITEFNSIKMERCILVESRHVEFPALIQYETDTDVIEYYPQPCEIELFRTLENPYRKFRVTHVPDFLVIRRDGILIEEWKMEKRLCKLVLKYPNRYLRESDGWHDSDSEMYFSDIGITYRLRSDADHPRQYINNTLFLLDYYTPSYPAVARDKLRVFQETLAEKSYLTISELQLFSNNFIKDELGEAHVELFDEKLIAYDDIYKAIADRHLAFDLHNDDISETHRALVYQDYITMCFDKKVESIAETCPPNETRCFSLNIGASIEYDGIPYQIQLAGKESITVHNESGTVELKIELVEKLFQQGKIRILNSPSHDLIENSSKFPSQKRMKKALQRLSELELADIDEKMFPKSKRTLQRYRNLQRAAGPMAIDQCLCLAKDGKKRGRKSKISKTHIEDIEFLVKTEYNNPTNKTRMALYTIYLELCETKGHVPIHRKTFYKLVNEHESILKREGKRRAYQSAEIIWEKHDDKEIHGHFPFQIVHIDHTLADLELRGFLDVKNLGKPWVSLAIDTASRKVLGQYLSFRAPSTLSNMMVLRDIVRKHGRMPNMITVDNGRDLQSNAFKQVQRLYRVSIRSRPAGQPRFGSVIERMFRTINTQFLHNLEGNTQLMKHVRMVTKSVRPEPYAKWTLPAFHAGLEYYCDHVLGEEINSGLGEKPNYYLKTRLTETGERKNRKVKYDRLFLIHTCLPPKQQPLRTITQHGIKVQHIWYSNKEFRIQHLEGKIVQVLLDPWDASVVYALVNDEWIECRSKLFCQRNRFTREELQYAMDEMANKFKVKKQELNSERVAEWIKLWNPANFDPRLSQQNYEHRLIYDKLNMTVVDQLSYQGEELFQTDTGVENLIEPASPETEAGNSNKEAEYDWF
jgi:putative transposase